MPESNRILIIGGGFAGVYTALSLDKHAGSGSGVEVTLVSSENYLLFTPMLHEVAASDLSPTDIVNPLRRMFRHITVLEGDVTHIDLTARSVTLSYQAGKKQRDLAYDRLVIAAGSDNNFFGNKELEANAVAMKTLTDAMLLRNRIIALLENAAVETDVAARRSLLTFVVAGGGFAGVETIGAVNDCLRGALRWYPQLRPEEIRIVLVHPKEVILPELGEKLGRYAHKKLAARQVEILTKTEVKNYTGGRVELSRGAPLEAATLIWTAGVTPGRLITELPCQKEHGRLVVNEFLQLAEHPGVWALGDCAWALDPATGKAFPTTAQHAVRQGKIVAGNVLASLRNAPQKPFRFKMLGQLAAIGRRTGVAQIFGVRFSGVIAWWMWRTIYLAKLPRLQKKLQVAMHWTMDLFFSKDLTQLLTAKGIEQANRSLEATRALASRPDEPNPAKP
jgi:NADH dehydrogenase